MLSISKHCLCIDRFIRISKYFNRRLHLIIHEKKTCSRFLSPPIFSMVWVSLVRHITCRIIVEPAPFMLNVVVADEVERNDKIWLKDRHKPCSFTCYHILARRQRIAEIPWKKGQMCILDLMNGLEHVFQTRQKKITNINLGLKRERKCFVSIRWDWAFAFVVRFITFVYFQALAADQRIDLRNS